MAKAWQREDWWLVAASVGLLVSVGSVLLYNRKRSQGLNGPAFRKRVPALGEAGTMKLKHHRGRMTIKDRVKIIQDLVWKSVQDPEMRKIALQTTKDCPERDGKCEARAIYHFIKSHVRYTGDVGPVKMGHDGPTEAVDLYQSARRTLEIGGGDCDDQAILAATLLALNGMSAKLRITKPRKDAEWSHIYVTTGLPKLRPTSWLPIDTTLPGSNWFGKEVPFAEKAEFDA